MLRKEIPIWKHKTNGIPKVTGHRQEPAFILLYDTKDE